MAEQSKTYIINFKDNLDKYAKNAAEAKKKIDELKETQKEMIKAGTASGVELEQLAAQIKVATAEYNSHKKMIENTISANNAAAGSYDKLYKTWAIAEKELKAMEGTLTKNAQGVTVLSDKYLQQKKAVEDAKRALNEFGKGVADNRLNVGNYEEAITRSLDKFKSMPGPVAAAAGSIEGLTTGFKGLTTAVKANPIIAAIAAIVGIFTSLFKIWKSTAEGGGEIKTIMAEIKGVSDELRARVIALMQGFKDLFSGNWKKLGEDMKEAFGGLAGDLKTAADNAAALSKAQRQLTKELAMRVSEEAGEAKAIQENIYLSKDRMKTDKERLAYIEKAIKISEEDAKQQSDFAKRQWDIDIQTAANKTKTTRETLEAWVKMDAEAQNDMLKNNQEIQKAYNILGGSAKLKELEESYAKVIQADTEFFASNKRNMSLRSGFLDELRKDEIKRLTGLAELNELEDKIRSEHNKTILAKDKAALNERLAQTGITQEQRLKLTRDYEDKVLALELKEGEETKLILKQKLDATLKDTELSNTERLVLKKQFEAAVIAIDEEAARRGIELRASRREQRTEQNKADQAAGFELLKLQAQNIEKQGKDNIDLLERIADQEYGALLMSVEYEKLTQNQKLLAEQKYNETKQQLADSRKAMIEAESGYQLESMKLDSEALTLAGENNIAIQEAILDREYEIKRQSLEYSRMTNSQQILIDKQYTNAKKQFSNMRIQQQQKEAAMVGDALGAIGDILGQTTAAGKAFAVAQATINTYVSASQTLADPSIPSTIARVAAMVSILATGFMNVRNILKVKTDGSGSGAASSSGSTQVANPLPATMHVTAKQATEQTNIPTALAASSSIAKQQNIFIPQISGQASQAQQSTAGMTGEEVVTAIKAIPAPVVTVEDINARTNETNKVKVRATI